MPLKFCTLPIPSPSYFPFQDFIFQVLPFPFPGPIPMFSLSLSNQLDFKPNQDVKPKFQTENFMT